MFFLVLLVLALGTSKFQSGVARDTITFYSPRLDDGTTLISAGNIFELGFFTPKGDVNRSRYLGIWYIYKSPLTVVWVANRNEPLKQVSGHFGVDKHGNINLLDDQGKSYFHTNLSSSSPVNRTLMLLDSGNLALIDRTSGNYLWQSFSEPTDTFLPGMKMDENLQLVSWKDSGNPAAGNFTFQLDEESTSHKIMKGSTVVYWKSDQSESTELPYYVDFFLSNFSSRVDQANNRSSFNYNYSYTRLLMNSFGEIQLYSYEEDGWSLMWTEPHDVCSVYNPCGDFGSCSLKNLGGLNCKCLPGFKPKLPDAWNAGDFSSGCDRKLPICNKTSKLDDTFLNLKLIKVRKRDLHIGADTDDKCRRECLDNCECQAYYQGGPNGRKAGAGCSIWTSVLTNLQEDYNDGGHNLSIRVAVASIAIPANTNQHEKQSVLVNRVAVIIFTTVIAVVLLAGSLSCFFYRRRFLAKRKESKESIPGNLVPYLDNSERQATDLVDEYDKNIDVPYFSLESILAATDNFSDTNKLGRGGFGPVYKGTFPGEREIAVKRLSSHSGQGTEEFQNEVLLIAKLQHRNLVKLLGYCIKGSEKILLYEYMPNKSLDTFIFDQGRCILLNWNMRFNIILGIARGILYLHQDSRLRIIHRDLKTSNILLDEEMNPKISDFGLARMVQDKATEANTLKVVGTYGYMSPEYAIEGFFSVKSDVFSFGVILLEIVSGKRNTTGFFQSEEVLSLLGYAWRLWQQSKAMNLVDKKLLESCNGTEVMKCINIGLLCVQDDPSDRPTMSNVLIMLSSETTTLSSPNQPTFVARRRTSSTSSSLTNKAESNSINEMTISVEEGR